MRRRFGFEEKHLVLHTRSSFGRGRLLLHPGGIVLKKIDDVKNERKPGGIEFVSPRLLYPGLSLIEPAQLLVAIDQTDVIVRTVGIDLKGSSRRHVSLGVISEREVDEPEKYLCSLIARIGLRD